MALWLVAGCLLASFATAAGAAANERLPAWLSISPALASSMGSRGDEFPPPEERAEWERSGYGYVDLLWRIEIRLEQSGMIESRVEIVRHFLSESGIAQAGNMEFFADAWRDQVTIETGYSSGTHAHPVFVDPQTIEVIPETASNIFSDWNRVIVPIPGLRPGSNGTIVGTRRFQSAHFPLKWSRITALGSTVPIARIEIEISAEAGAPEIEWATDDEALNCQERGAGRLSCTRTNIPAIFLDRDVTSYLDRMSHFYVGVSDTWSDLQASVRSLVEESAKPTPSLREKVAELEINPAASSEEKLWRLLRFVADEVRYVSLSHGDSSVVPHPASLTLSRRYGDCKDKVTLLVALGRLVGLEITPVLTSTERKDLKRVLRPSSSYFDHMIACIGSDLEGVVCVDPTQAYSGLALSPLLNGAIALALGPQSPAALSNLPTTKFGWEIQVHRERTFQPDGSVSTSETRRFSGPGSAIDRAQLLALSSADRTFAVAAQYKQVHDTTTAPDFTFQHLTDPDVDFEIASEISTASGYQSNVGAFYGFDPWLIYHAVNMISVNRHHPYRLLGLRYTAEETIALCCNDIQFYGPELEFESEFGSLRRSFMKIDGVLVMKSTFELPALVIPPDQVPTLESFIMQSTRESGFWLTWQLED